MDVPSREYILGVLCRNYIKVCEPEEPSHITLQDTFGSAGVLQQDSAFLVDVEDRTAKDLGITLRDVNDTELLKQGHDYSFRHVVDVYREALERKQIQQIKGSRQVA